MTESCVCQTTAGASHDQQHKHGTPAHPDNRAGWYILRVGAGLDFPAEEAMGNAGWKVFLAREYEWRACYRLRRKATEVGYPRFPGYLFIHVTPPRWPSFDVWPLATFARGILAMDGRPVPLAPGEIERLLAEDGEVVPHVASMPVRRAFTPGQSVRVLAGAFRDFEATLDAIDEAGAHITVQLFGRPTPVPLPLTWLEAA